MCVAAVALSASPRWRLVMIGNRDEYHQRPTAPLSRWNNGILAGRDLQAGGTWLGANAAGRFALVTNYRVDGYPRAHLASRGALVAHWLLGSGPDGIAAMNPFNLLLVDGPQAWHLTNHPAPQRRLLDPGIHGLSNGGFDDRWAKTLALEAALAGWLERDDAAMEPLFTALRSEAPLPGPGPSPEFSSAFIRNPLYGTRCSTVLTVDAGGAGRIAERRFDADGQATGETVLDFRWD
ncbi:NRDE family protein [Novosphingobium cyanobacteriorum]|uniref:NRDE family protein n=1 Tax=Novosphingobium cyanobacteriorum TaxID=3024215 RepID=A0ABT6CHN6_9SPHN|nr:NRDE family protein [Novosphingobium cyanobacteriorum]MDF8333431.1 NRDE family protein [Novosphingobium cyanobacteriorum]